MTTRALGTWAVRNAIVDAGLKASDVDGMLSLPVRRRSRPSATFIAGDLGIRPQLLHGRVRRRLVDRGAGRHGDRPDRGRHAARPWRSSAPMNGFSQVRIGGTGARAAAPVAGRHAAQPRLWLAERRPDVRADLHAPHVRLRHDARAGRARQARSTAATPRTTRRPIYKKRFTVEDVLNSRIICKPLHLLDCCVETDNGTALIVDHGRAGARTASTIRC